MLHWQIHWAPPPAVEDAPPTGKGASCAVRKGPRTAERTHSHSPHRHAHRTRDTDDGGHARSPARNVVASITHDKVVTISGAAADCTVALPSVGWHAETVSDALQVRRRRGCVHAAAYPTPALSQPRSPGRQLSPCDACSGVAVRAPCSTGEKHGGVGQQERRSEPQCWTQYYKHSSPKDKLHHLHHVHVCNVLQAHAKVRMSGKV